MSVHESAPPEGGGGGTEAEEAAWEMATAETLRARGELAEAATWYRRAANHLMEAGEDERAIAIAKLAAELAALDDAGRPSARVAASPAAESVAARPAPVPPAAPAVAPRAPAPAAAAAARPVPSAAPPTAAAQVQEPEPMFAPADRTQRTQSVGAARPAPPPPAAGKPQPPKPELPWQRGEAASIARPAPVAVSPSTRIEPPPWEKPETVSPRPSAAGAAAGKPKVPPPPAPPSVAGAPAAPKVPPPPGAAAPVAASPKVLPPRPPGAAAHAPASVPRPPGGASTAAAAAVPSVTPAVAPAAAAPLPVAAPVRTPFDATDADKTVKIDTRSVPPDPNAPPPLVLDDITATVDAAPAPAPAAAAPAGSIADMVDEAVSTIEAVPSIPLSGTPEHSAHRPSLVQTSTRAAEVDQIAARLPALPLFAELPADRLPALARQIGRVQFVTGEALCESGAPEGPLFVLVEGSAWVGVAGSDEPIAIVGAGDFVGEMAALFGGPRTATVTAQNAVETLAFAPSLVRALAREHDAFRAALEESACERARESLPHVAPLLRRLPDSARDEAMAGFSFSVVPEGTLLLTEGEVVDGLVVVAAGEVELYGGESGARRPRHARVGDALGVASLVTSSASGVSARASRAVLVARLPAARFHDAVARYAEWKDVLADVGSPGRGVIC